MAKFIIFDADINKILFKTGKPTGGAAVQTSIWMKGLIEIGNDVIIPIYSIKDKIYESTTQNIRYIHLYNEHEGLKWIRWIYYRIPNLYRKLKELRPDYLYESIPSWKSFFTGIICKKLNIKYIIRLSSDNILDDRFLENYSKTHQLLLKKAIKSCDYLLCQNDYQYSQAQKLFPKNNILKISNPFILTQSKKSSIRNYIAWVGNFRYVKNLKLLYQIAKYLEHEQFEIAGVHSANKDPETTEYIKKLQGLKNVNFLGHLDRERVFEFLSAAKYLLNTSRYEGFSNTFLEAMSVGTPILSTANANPDHILTKNNLGIIYQNYDDLGAKLKKTSLEDYQLMSERTIQYVKDNHDYKRLSEKMMDFLAQGKSRN